MTALPLAEAQRDVASLFLATFERAPEFAAMQWYVAQYQVLLEAHANKQHGHSQALKQLASQIYADGVQAGEVPAGSTVSNAWYVAQVYQKLLGRPPDAEGAAWWTAQLESGAIDRGGVVAQMLVAARSSPGVDAHYVANRETVATAFAEWSNSNPQILPKLPYNAAEVMLGVDANPASITEAWPKLYQVAGLQGEHFALTPNIDQLKGTPSNDLFSAWPVNPVTGEAAGTLTPFDRLDGGEGDDTLDLFIDAAQGINASWPAMAEVLAIENVKLHYLNGVTTDALADSRHYQGVHELWQIGGVADVTWVNDGVLAGLREFGELNAATIVALPGSDTLRLALHHSDWGNAEPDRLALQLKGDELQQVSIQGDIAAATVILAVTVGGIGSEFKLDTAVNSSVGPVLNAEGQWVSVLDARGSTGDVSWVVLLPDTTAWGGAGNDTFFIDEGSLSLDLHIDGQAGYNTVALLQSSFQTQDYDALNQMQNVQQLSFNSHQLALNAGEVATFGRLRFDDQQQDPNAPFEVQEVQIAQLQSHQALTLASNTRALIDLSDSQEMLQLTLEGNSHVELAIDALRPGDSGGVLAVAGEVGSSLLFDNAVGWNPETEQPEPLQIGKFAVIDAAALEGNLDLRGLSAPTAEIVHLGSGANNAIQWSIGNENELGSSSIGRLDIITGYDAEATEFYGLGTVTHLELSTGVSNLQQAWAEAAASYASVGSNVLYFHFNHHTYVYADTVNSLAARYDADDFAFRIDGVHELFPAF